MEVVRLAVTPSTQEVARTLPLWTVVVADHQTAGRGRLDRRWEAPPGTALLASFVVPFHPLATFAAGVATAEACGPEVRLKWPNDLLLGDRKLAGILAEAHRDRAIIGIGINLLAAPEGAAMLGPTDRDALVDRIAEGLERWLAAPRERLLDAWRARSDTLGRRVRIDLGREVVEGVADGITDEGALVVDGRRLAAGDVVHLRRAPLPPPPAPPPPRGEAPRRSGRG